MPLPQRLYSDVFSALFVRWGRKDKEMNGGKLAKPNQFKNDVSEKFSEKNFKIPWNFFLSNG